MGSSLTKCNICKSVSISPSSGPSSKSAEKPTIKLLLLGLDNAGKTTTVLHLMGEPLQDIISTVGFSNLEMKKYHRFRVIVYDLGGGSRIRGIWRNYFALVHGIVFVIDSADISRILEVKDVIESVIQNEKVSGKPILLLINKQDIDGAMDEIDVCKYINLEPLINKFKCPTRIESCSAFIRPETKTKVDPAIDKGYQWLMRYIERNWSVLNNRVQSESNEQYAAERKDMEERLKRFRQYNHSTHITEDDKECDTKDPALNGDPFQPIKEVVKEIKQINELKAITDAMKSDNKDNDIKSHLTHVSPVNEDAEKIEIIHEDANYSYNSPSPIQGVDEVMKLFSDVPNKSVTSSEQSILSSHQSDNISIVEIHHYNNEYQLKHNQNDTQSHENGGIAISSGVTSPSNSINSQRKEKKKDESLQQ